MPCGGYTTVRFFSDNPGYWIMHCHIENHHGNGMALLVKEGTQEQIKSLVNVNEINTCFKGYKEFHTKHDRNKETEIWQGLFFGMLALVILSDFLFAALGYYLIKNRQKAITTVHHGSEQGVKKF